MVFQVNQELCAGYGVCMEACSFGAIQLVDQRAVIDDALCIQCEACIDACPNEAISALSIPARSMAIAVLPAVETQIVTVQSKATSPDTASLARGIMPLAGAALTFLGRELTLRLVDVLVSALECRLERPKTTVAAPLPTSSRVFTTQSRGKRWQARYRDGRSGYRNHKERR